ncbi:uncharacterized protein B0I36DRAFT_344475 [Microdochium trichocladiopsis]|uniref:Uncharacterized protein n=1 Tax=Microdochium trichocladiopsis TaxID=1682393 RepID=A0A9P8YKQ4_9PEZI|nr:uncharacterized protein B0I36DRAFT_344475 [Microdochium trichocladiopsis]KAH7040794.1 hypothetical protein B0I36DRAFT_344475 [Microdochium trichocladiopsis]
MSGCLANSLCITHADSRWWPIEGGCIPGAQLLFPGDPADSCQLTNRHSRRRLSPAPSTPLPFFSASGLASTAGSGGDNRGTSYPDRTSVGLLLPLPPGAAAAASAAVAAPPAIIEVEAEAPYAADGSPASQSPRPPAASRLVGMMELVEMASTQQSKSGYVPWPWPMSVWRRLQLQVATALPLRSNPVPPTLLPFWESATSLNNDIHE